MSTSAKAPTARQFFSRHGLLSRWHPNYEFRPGQLEMAEAVEAALKDRRHLIVEAGTGTGKTLAYLVPAILSGKRRRHLHRHQEPPGTALLQGRPLPAAAFRAAAAGLLHEGPQQLRLPAEDLRRRKAAHPDRPGRSRRLPDHPRLGSKTETGDRAEIATLPENSTAWAKVDARARAVHGPEVPAVRPLLHHADAPAGAGERHHHRQPPPLLRRPRHQGERGDAGIMPEYDAVVFDEAHEIEDVAGQYFGVSVSNYQFTDLRRDIGATARAEEFRIGGTRPHSRTGGGDCGRGSSGSSAADGRTAFRDTPSFSSGTTASITTSSARST